MRYEYILVIVLSVILPLALLLIKPIRQFDYRKKTLISSILFAILALFCLVKFLTYGFTMTALPAMIVLIVSVVCSISFILIYLALGKNSKDVVYMPFGLYVFLHLLGVCCFIGSFVNALVFSFVSSLYIGLCIAEPLLCGGLGILIFVNYVYGEQKESKNTILIKAMPSNIKIDIENKTLKYKNINVKLENIVSYEVINNDEVIIKSGIGEAIAGGLLFGDVGAIAGAYAGKREVTKKSVKLFIETNDIRNAGFVIKLSLDNAYKFDKTYKLLMK